MTKLTSKAKTFLSEEMFNKVVKNCSVLEIDKDQGFREILKYGVERYCKHQTNDLYDVLMGDNQELIDYITSNMSLTFDEIAIKFGYTEYS